MSDDDDRLVGLYASVPATLRKRIRQEAANEDISMSQVITFALRQYFKMPKGVAPRQDKKND